MQIECHDSLDGPLIAEWRAFAEASPHAHPRQDPCFAAVERAVGRRPLFALGRRNGTLCAAGLFSLHRGRVPGRFAVATALSGPVCDDAATLVEFLRTLSGTPAFARVDALRVTPYWIGAETEALSRTLNADGWIRSDPEPARSTGLVDLACSEADLRASFSRSARRKVRLVEKSEITIRPIQMPAEAAIFFERLNTLVLAPHNLSRVSPAEWGTGFEVVFTDPKVGVIFGAFYDDAFLGGLLLYRSHHTAHARRYVADPGAAKQAVSNLRVAPSLWLEGMLWAREQGCKRFDVEGYRLIEDKDDPSFNVYEYKREFGPTPVQRLAEHTLPLSKGRHLANELPGRIRRTVKQAFPALAELRRSR